MRARDDEVDDETSSGVGIRRRAAVGAQPTTERGRRTRTQLLTAARTVFERDGYLSARVADIATEAGAAHGSFYTYFDSKADIFRILINDLTDSGLYAVSDRPDAPRDTRPPSLDEAWQRIEAGNRRYIRLFQRDQSLLALFEQVASFDEEMRRHRLELRRRSAQWAGDGIRRLQDWGLADRDLDPDLAAHALTAMVTQYVYYWLVMGADFDEESSVATLTRLWARAIGLGEPDRDTARAHR